MTTLDVTTLPHTLTRRQPTVPPQAPLARLREGLPGRVITPDDPRYDAVRSSLSRKYLRRPAVIARPRDVAEVAQAVVLARETGLELAVRSGGHSLAAFSTSEGGLVLDLSQMKGLEVDVEAQTAWAETGLTAGEYTAETVRHGLVTGFGDTASVGIAGLTIGGGIGYLVRKYGLTVDNLLAARVVTADGQIRAVDAANYPDLFWAIRGGGGNFGVVTDFKFRLHPAANVVGGLLMLPATPEVVAGFAALAEAAPDELSTIVSLMPAPPLPFVPEEYHGQLVAQAMMVYAGAVNEGLRVLAPFRQLATPIVDQLGPMPYPNIYRPEDPHAPSATALRSKFVDRVDERTARVMLDHLRASSAPIRVAEFRVLGGAMARVPADATAFAHRASRVMLSFIIQYEDRDEAALHDQWVADGAAAVGPGKGVYVNFLGDEGQARVQEAYPQATRQRLAAIKARYDPTNLFRRNQNIAPGAR